MATIKEEWQREQNEGKVPKFHKGKSISDYWTCGNCGHGIHEIHFNWCPNCGYRILWDSPRCLTGYPKKKVKKNDGNKTVDDRTKREDSARTEQATGRSEQTTDERIYDCSEESSHNEDSIFQNSTGWVSDPNNTEREEIATNTLAADEEQENEQV